MLHSESSKELLSFRFAKLSNRQRRFENGFELLGLETFFSLNFMIKVCFEGKKTS